ncbi:hypothetical protein [Anaerosporobacter sp.]|uniref:hypothetical protein n=1 Tax=Anaerosporobacter sp. TaxID=1872529 RepID=UPI00286FACD0|nr:hypothetical protein [Anaerosporobacter sp.]
MFDYKLTKKFFLSNRHIYKKHLLPRRPRWLKEDKSDLMNGVYEQLKDYFTHGEIAISCIVQANVLLFEKGRTDCPAGIIYSFDPYYIDNPYELKSIASDIFSLKNTTGNKEEIQYFVDVITDEYVRVFRKKLPSSFTQGREVYFTCIMVQRKCIPYRRLTQSIYPALILEKDIADAILLPKWYWKEE